MSENRDFLDTLNVTNVREHPEPEQDKPQTDDEQETEAEEAEETEQEQEGGEAEQKDKGGKAEQGAATAAAGESKEAAGFKAGMLAERKKRQELEARLRELEAKQKQPEQPAPKPVQFREDPERFVSDAVEGVRAQYLNALEDDMREQHPDFDEVATLVMEAAKLDPSLHAKVFAAGNPARAMYKLGKQLQEAEKLRDPEAYAESIREAVRAEEAAKLRKELGLPEDGKPARAALPRDLSNGRSGTETVATTQPVDPRRGEFATLFDQRRPT